MRMLNCGHREKIVLRRNGRDIIVTMLEPAMIGNWVRVYKKPSGRHVGQLEMGAPAGWKFVFSFPYEGKN